MKVKLKKSNIEVLYKDEEKWKQRDQCADETLRQWKDCSIPSPMVETPTDFSQQISSKISNRRLLRASLGSPRKQRTQVAERSSKLG